jgi:hypothetical protein
LVGGSCGHGVAVAPTELGGKVIDFLALL